ncbi:class I SAM-dependent methyltransferase [Alphaproteobacteria bacterium]|nr:class I SAM-dependent methyltransferase [Alphaproteobacteria bacterium]
MSELQAAVRERIKDQKNLAVLEIGALDKPFLMQDESSIVDPKIIEYLDHLSTEELREKYLNDPSIDTKSIVHVDHVSVDGEIPSSIEKGTFDVVIGRHVGEHVPNFIKWLQDILLVLKPGGIVLLILPDKRFTFDLRRSSTTFGEMLEAYFGNHKRPTVKSVYDFFSRATYISGHDIWTGKLDESSTIPLFSGEDALLYANEVIENQAYIDVHVSVFTPSSFLEILRHLILNGLLRVDLEKFEDTKIGQIEFSVVLRKPDESEEWSKDRVLEKLPQIALDSILSPYMPQVASLSQAMENATEIIGKLQQDLKAVHGDLKKSQEELLHVREYCRHIELTLDRRSVKLMISLVHYCFKILSIFRFRAR